MLRWLVFVMGSQDCLKFFILSAESEEVDWQSRVNHGIWLNRFLYREKMLILCLING